MNNLIKWFDHAVFHWLSKKIDGKFTLRGLHQCTKCDKRFWVAI